MLLSQRPAFDRGWLPTWPSPAPLLPTPIAWPGPGWLCAVYCYYYYRLFVHALVAVGYHSAYVLIGWVLSHDKLLSTDNKMLPESYLAYSNVASFPSQRMCVFVVSIWLPFSMIWLKGFFNIDRNVEGIRDGEMSCALTFKRKRELCSPGWEIPSTQSLVVCVAYLFRRSLHLFYSGDLGLFRYRKGHFIF